MLTHPFLAAVDTPLGGAATGAPWWQAVGGLLAVFALLILFLRLLARYQQRAGAGPAKVRGCWHLGPKREIQVLQLGDEVHYVYRQDGAMVLLKQLPAAEHDRLHGSAAQERTEAGSGAWIDRVRSWLPFLSSPAAAGRPVVRS